MQSPKREQDGAWHQGCGRLLPRPPSQTGTQHQCGDGHDDPRSPQEESRKRAGWPVPSTCVAAQPPKPLTRAWSRLPAASAALPLPAAAQAWRSATTTLPGKEVSLALVVWYLQGFLTP